jgi:hypothetical protein
MPGHQYTQTEYALQKVVENFGNLLSSLAEHHSTHTYAVVFRFCELENIDILVLRYLNTGVLPFGESSEEWLFDGEAKSFSIWETVIGTVSICKYWRKQQLS